MTPEPAERPRGRSPEPDARLNSMFAALVVLAAIAVVLLLADASWQLPGVILLASGGACWIVYNAGERARRRDLREVERMLIELAPPEQPDQPTEGEAHLPRVLARLATVGQRLGRRVDELQRERDAMRQTIDAADVPVLVVEPGGRVSLANRRALGLFAPGRRAVVGTPIDDLFAREEILSLRDQAAAGTPAEARVRMVFEHEPRYFDVRAAPLARGSQPEHGSVVLTLTDVTQLATTLQLKTDFAANASHELRTPLALIRGATETLDAGADDAEDELSARMRTIIRNNVGRLEEIINDLLDLSRLEAPQGEPQSEPVAASAVADRLGELFAGPAAEASVTLRFDLDPALERMYIDPKLLEMILRNLVDNAIKFARPETEVVVWGRPGEVGTRPGAVTPHPSRLSLAGARFRVIDKGLGIPLKHQNRIFERFYQVDGSRDGAGRRGSGLGLAIVKHALLRLGGRIEVDSVWQEGTTMRLEIPHCVATPERKADATAPTDTGMIGGNGL